MIEQDLIFTTAASLCAVIAAVFDIRSRRVPNLLTGPCFLAALGLHLALGGWHGMLNALLASLACGVVFFLFYLAGGMGAGDVKLIAVAGGFAGLSAVPILLVFTALAGGAMALALAFFRGRMRETLFNVGTIARHHLAQGLQAHPEINVRNSSQLRLPYAIAIAAGCLLTEWARVGQGIGQ
ncbi:A24 family peptidase [Granulicella paludicola]|uniref:A24 family peptidase n=1 Tax=Granulicella paludicola TaxID=474951 RepID=UPI0021DFA2E4|nr:prepilin peptidase [Granulicella paludicola]